MVSSLEYSVYTDALVVLGAAGLIVPVVRRLGFSPVLGYLGAGALLGPLGLGAFSDSLPILRSVTITGEDRVTEIADLGVVFLLFMIGLELSFNRLMVMRRLVFGLGGLQVVVSTALLALVLSVYGLPSDAALMLGACFALSSTAIVLELLAQQDRMTSHVGRTAFAILLAQDIAVIPLLMYISVHGGDAATQRSLFVSLGVAMAQAVLAVAIIVGFGRLFMRPVFRLVASVRSNELMMATILFAIIGSGFVASLAGLSMTLGAFVAGLLLAETAYSKVVEATIEPFKGLLLGVFFFAVGMKIDVRVILAQPLLLVQAIALLLAIKGLVLFALTKMFGATTPAGFETALLLAAAGEFAFVGMGLAATLNILDPKLSSFAVVVAALSMALIPSCGAVAHRVARRMRALEPLAPELEIAPRALQHHAIVIGHGRVGKVVCEMLRRHKKPYVAVDFNANNVIADRRAGLDVYFGDATRIEFLQACGLNEANGVIITLDEREVIDKIVLLVREARKDTPLVSRARDAVHASHLYGLGVTDAVPETIEASLQLSEAALIGLGVPTGRAIVSVHTYRDELRQALQAAAALARQQANHNATAP